MSDVSLLSGTRSEIEGALADLGVVTRTDFEGIVENFLSKWT